MRGRCRHERADASRAAPGARCNARPSGLPAISPTGGEIDPAARRTGDEERLKATVNFDQGRPHLPRSVSLGDGIGPVAWHFRRRRPGSGYTSGGERIRIPASDISYVAVPEDYSVHLRMPWGHSALRRINMLGGFEEAALTAARAGAAKMGFFTRTVNDDDNAAADGPDIEEMEPGMMETLPAGYGGEKFDTGYPDGESPLFVKLMLRGAPPASAHPTTAWQTILRARIFPACMSARRKSATNGRRARRARRGSTGEDGCRRGGRPDREASADVLLHARHPRHGKSDRPPRPGSRRFEFEVGEAAAKKAGREARGIMVPNDVLVVPQVRTTLTYGTPATAGNLVAKDLASASFIDVLRNAMMTRALGATIFNDLVGDLDIPRKSSASSATWISAEGGDATETNFTTDLVQFRLKTIAAYTVATRKMMAQSSLDIETMVRDDLAQGIALGVDFAALHGSGAAGQPTGIAGTAGIGSVVGGANGVAPAWSHIVNLETEVLVDNAAIGSLAYLTNAKVRGKLKQVVKAASTAEFVWDNEGLNGYRTEVSNQVSSDADEGHVHRRLFGDLLRQLDRSGDRLLVGRRHTGRPDHPRPFGRRPRHRAPGLRRAAAPSAVLRRHARRADLMSGQGATPVASASSFEKG